jgi:hypothetical protein
MTIGPNLEHRAILPVERKEQSMKNGPLILSLALNVFLVILILVMPHLENRKAKAKAMRAAAGLTSAQVQWQEGVLKDLDSADESKIKTAREVLRQKIDEGKKQVADWHAALGK